MNEEDPTKIRENLSTMTFEDLQKLKQKIGLKEFDELVLGKKPRTPKTEFKRANKNRPREMSSKRKHQEKITTQIPITTGKPPVARDPRFDPMCGSYDSTKFVKRYKFINEIRVNEKKALQEELTDTTDEIRRKKIQFLLQRMDNQTREHEKREKQQADIKEEQKDIKDKLKRGEKPIYKKKSERRLENLVKQYEELKKSNKLQKHIEKRSKRLVGKEKKKELHV